jgi:hypothetical protein
MVAGQPCYCPQDGGKLWMCINYTSLNKACPKDPFPLPRIDQIMDSTSGCDLLCFLDAYLVFIKYPCLEKMKSTLLL